MYLRGHAWWRAQTSAFKMVWRWGWMSLSVFAIDSGFLTGPNFGNLHAVHCFDYTGILCRFLVRFFTFKKILCCHHMLSPSLALWVLLLQLSLSLTSHFSSADNLMPFKRNGNEDEQVYFSFGFQLLLSHCWPFRKLADILSMINVQEESASGDHACWKVFINAIWNGCEWGYTTLF